MWKDFFSRKKGDEQEFDAQNVSEIKKRVTRFDEKTLSSFSSFFSEAAFWGKLKKYAKKIGSSAVYAMLLLYYTMRNPDVPAKAKTIILGALGYAILPLDLIPDAILGLGFVDDVSLLIWAVSQVASHIDEPTKERAKIQLAEWFGAEADTKEIDDQLK